MILSSSIPHPTPTSDSIYFSSFSGWIMAVITTVLAWVLALLSVSTTAKEHKGFWEYFSHSGWEKGRIEQIEQQKLSKEFLNLKANIEQDISNVDTFFEKLEPLTGQGKPPLLFLDSRELQHQLHTELEEKFQDQVAHHTGRVKALFHPYAERLVTGIGQHVQELHRNVAPHAATSPARLSRYIQALSKKLTLKAQALHTRIQDNLDQLRDELTAYAGAREDEDVGGLGQDSQLPSEELTKEVHQRLEAFRLDTFQEIADFTRAIDRETEELQQQLAPPPSAHNAFSPEQLGDDGDRKVLGELRSRLDALWEDIHYNLQDQGHGLSGTP
ncbi:apolipoprotein A-V isoform X5 [Notamacropus eugenii]|uniref:apolipoprotein A-V isoform X5 n=1 Tax=Notamacropus eugenii TaxID=9315 RepID=UPI003B678F48